MVLFLVKKKKLCLIFCNILVFSEKQKETCQMAESKKDLFDAPEPGILGWEVLEAEGTVTEKQDEMSSPLLRTIVDVFQKG